MVAFHLKMLPGSGSAPMATRCDKGLRGIQLAVVSAVSFLRSFISLLFAIEIILQIFCSDFRLLLFNRNADELRCFFARRHDGT